VEEFAQVIRRTASGRQTEQDKSIFVNHAPSFGPDDEHHHAAIPAVPVLNRRKLADTPISHAPKGTFSSTTNTENSATNSVKDHPEEPEKSSTGTSGSWWIVALGAVALALAALFLLRR
jgi:LPXTG-motif cell wall-anchored protein